MMAGSILLMPVYLMMAYLPASRYVTFAFPWISQGHVTIEHATLPLLLLVTSSDDGDSVLPDSGRYVAVGGSTWGPVPAGDAYALMTLIQQIGFFIMNLLIGKANDYSEPAWAIREATGLGCRISPFLGFVGLTFAILLRIRETGPDGHGLETITTASDPKPVT